jgi:hypothetical protein
MKNYKDYIGKTFKGFEFEDEKHSDLDYNINMNKFIGKDLEIKNYSEEDNSFLTDSDYYYPAELVIAQLEKQETEIENEIFKPKRGDRVLVWDSDEEYAEERIFLTEIEGAEYPYVCVSKNSEKLFEEGKYFTICDRKYIKPLPQKVIPKDTLVWVRDSEDDIWLQMYYSHFSDGEHYCFRSQKKSNQAISAAHWKIVTDKNPFK